MPHYLSEVTRSGCIFISVTEPDGLTRVAAYCPQLSGIHAVFLAKWPFPWFSFFQEHGIKLLLEFWTLHHIDSSAFVIVIIAHGLAGWGPHAYFQMLAESRNEVQSSSLHANNHLMVQQPDLDSVYIDSHRTVEASQFNIRETSPILEEREGYGRHWHWPQLPRSTVEQSRADLMYN